MHLVYSSKTTHNMAYIYNVAINHNSKQKIQRFKYSPQPYSLVIHDTSLKNKKNKKNSNSEGPSIPNSL